MTRVVAGVAAAAALLMVVLFGGLSVMAGAGASSASVTDPGGGGGGGSGGGALKPGAAIPAPLIPLFEGAGTTCASVTPALLAGQDKQESQLNAKADNGIAFGIAQFTTATWQRWGVDGDGDGVADVFNPADAIPAQARYDCYLASQVTGIPGDPAQLMLAAYNAGLGWVQHYRGVPPFPETQNYVVVVVQYAQSFTDDLVGGGGGSGSGPAPSGTVAAVLADARAELDVPYCWGGGDRSGPTQGDCAPAAPGFDCSGLVEFAYWQGARFTFAAGTNASGEYASTSDRPVAANALQPGDLLFYGGSPGTIHHVAIYSGGGRMIEAPHSGALVREVPVRLGGDFLAATRPSGNQP